MDTVSYDVLTLTETCWQSNFIESVLVSESDSASVIEPIVDRMTDTCENITFPWGR